MKIRSSKGSFTAFLLLYILTSCAIPSATIQAPIPIILTPTATTIFPTSTIKPTASSQLLPTSTKTFIAGFQWKPDGPVAPCITVQSTLPTGLHVPGLLLGSRIMRGPFLYALDPNSGQTNQLISDSFIHNPDNLVGDGYYVSPDGKWLTYYEREPREHSIAVIVEPITNILTKSSKGRLTWHPDKSYYDLLGWLNNDAIILTKKPVEDTYLDTVIYYPFTGQQKIFSYKQISDFPAYPFLIQPYIFKLTDFILDPTLSRIIYPTRSKDRHERVMLWDVETQKTLGDGFRMFRDAPLAILGWSLDGNDFIMKGYDDITDRGQLFQIYRNGDTRQLTSFHEYISDRGSRSWDGRYLALHIEYASSRDGKYLIMDLKSSDPQGICIDEVNKVAIDPVWSPDSKYVVFSDGEQNILGNWILVDVEKREAYYIAKDLGFSAIGWLAVDDPLPSVTPTP